MSEDLETRRKRLIFRSCYTGMKETDILLGTFAKRYLPEFTAAQIATYEALIETHEDPQIYAWMTGRTPVPEAYDTDVMQLMKAFKLDR